MNEPRTRTPQEPASQRAVLARPDWSAPDAGARYRERRWDNQRSARDPRRAAELLQHYLSRVDGARVLDAPAGSGRLGARLTELCGRPPVALDASPQMLAHHSQAHDPLAERVLARVEALPFRDRSFDAVVCCRLLHHLADPDELVRALAELLRVSAGPLIASFWCSQSWPGWRRRIGLSRPDPSGRRERPRAEIAAAVAAAGGRVLGFHPSSGWWSAQTFVVARGGAAR